MIWLDLIGRGWELVAAGVLLAAGIAIITGHGGEYSCAPADSDDEWDEGDAWDRGHDRWVDEQNEVA